jgi:type VI secretion system secreted protein VgrG
MKKGVFAEVRTPLGDKVLLRGMTGSEELGRPFAYHVELLSEDEGISGSAMLGQGVTLKLALEEEGSERCIHGICTSFGVMGRIGRYALYEAQLRPWIWLLSHSSDCRIF